MDDNDGERLELSVDPEAIEGDGVRNCRCTGRSCSNGDVCNCSLFGSLMGVGSTVTTGLRENIPKTMERDTNM